MPNIGLPELVIVLVIALVVFGPKRLPEMGRQIGRAIREFRSATTDLRSDLGVDEVVGAVNDVKSSFSLAPDQPAAGTVAGPAAGAAADEAAEGEVVDPGPAAASDPLDGEVVDAEVVPEPGPAGDSTRPPAGSAPAGLDGAGI